MKIVFKICILTFSIIFLLQCKPKERYIHNEGFIFGTTYHIKYESTVDYHKDIILLLNEFNKSLSTYDKNSTISKINRNESFTVDSYFKECFVKAQKISEITNGAFDMTVAPLVNIWGFGFEQSADNDSLLIDSIKQIVGYKKIVLYGDTIIKSNPNIMLDASAVAKGYGVDIVAQYLLNKGVTNLMVEIGGEISAKGVNQSGKYWKVGIDKPIDDPTALNREIQEIVFVNNKCLATSGNYRQFYVKDGVKYSHTINPFTGYPARNTLLSTSVLADDCLTADAFATAFMVLGIEEGVELAKSLNYIDVYFIYFSPEDNELKTFYTEKFFLEK